MTRARKIADLHRIADLLADRALAPIARAQADVDRTQAKLVALETHRGQLALDTDDPMMAALLARQSARLRQAQEGVYRTLAQQQATLETAKATARPAVGRKNVLKSLLERHVSEARKAARRGGW